MAKDASDFTVRRPFRRPGWRTAALVAVAFVALSTGLGGLGLAPAGAHAGTAPVSSQVSPAELPSSAPTPPANPGQIVTPILQVSVLSGPIHTNVSFTASGFAHNSLFSITWTPSGGPATACSGRTSATGGFGCGYSILPTGAGTYVFTGKDAVAHQATASFTVISTLIDQPSSGSVGTIVIVSGFAFNSSSSTNKVGVTVAWNGGVVCPSTATTTNLWGNFTCAFALPPASAGPHSFVANDTKGHSASATFTVVPQLTVTPAYAPGSTGYGPTGSTVVFRGTGFGASVPVALTWPIGSVCAPTTTATGGFGCSYTIPAEAPGGLYTFTASDGPDHASVGFDLTFLAGSPSATTVGSLVAISGGGYSPNSSVVVSWAQGPLVTESSNATGVISPFNFTVPSLAFGTYVFSAVDGAGLRASFGLTVVPSLSASPAGGAAPTTVAFLMTGFAANSPISLTWTAGVACGGTTNSTGSFPCSFHVNASTPGGVYTFTATDGLGDVARTVFTVTYLQILPPTGPVNTTVSISGGGYTPGSKFNVTLGATVACTGTISPAGTLPTACLAFKIPPAPAGSLTFVALDASGATASATFTVGPKLTVNPSGGTVGTTLSFSGSGFGAGVSVAVGWSRGSACSNVTGSLGSFACTFVLPSASAGPYLFTAIDAGSNTARTTFTVLPRLTAVAGSGPVGSSVILSASGFAASSGVTISSPVALACTGTTDLGGSFVCSYAIPSTTKGTLTFTAVDSSSDAASAAFGVVPQLLVLPVAGPVGTVLSFSGSGFSAGSTATVSWSAGVGCTATTSPQGGFSCSYLLPAATAGAHTFTARDSAVPANSASATFTVSPQLATNVSRGFVGSSVLFRGTGFGANATVSVNASGTTVCSSTAGTFGSFSCSGAVPPAPAGNLTVVASDTGSHAAATFFRIDPNLLATPSSGPVDTNVTFLATGFAASATIRVGWSAGTVCSGPVASNGSFRCAVQIPPATAGAHLFTATDAAGNVANGTFTVLSSFSAGLTASPSGGPPGTLVTLQGTGFAQGATVNVTWSGGLACSPTADVSGSFSCLFTIPLSTAGGTYTFTGSDGRGDTSSATFVVTFLAVQPGDGPAGTHATLSGGGFSVSSSYTVSWSGGTACSGTTSVSGGFSCTVTIPGATLSGRHLFVASDGAGTKANTTFVVDPTLVANLSQGPVGTVVGFTGAAFAPTHAYSLNWSGGTACSGTTSAQGNFTCSFQIPRAAAGPHAFVAADGTGNSTSTSFAVRASLRDAPASGPVGGSVTFTGSGYAAGLPVSVNGSGLGCSAVVNSTGDFACTLSIPPRAAGAYAFTGSQGTGLPHAAATFTVVSNLTVVPVQGPLGTTLVFTATGFGSSVAIAVDWLGGTACTGTTSGVGSFSCTYSVAALSGGSTTFTAADSLGNHASTSFLVVPALTVSPGVGDPGTLLTLQGVGFQASGSATITWSGGGTVCTTTADLLGGFTCSFTIPLSTPGGTYTFVATDGLGDSGTAVFTVTFLTALPASGPVGTSVSFNGGGFASGVAYTVTWSGGTACQSTTSGSGTFHCAFTLPSAAAGAHLFTASDGSGHTASSVVTTVPSLAVSPGSGPAHAAVTFTGTGFAASLSVTVNWSGGVACTSTTDLLGNFSCGFTLPGVSLGVYSFTATDAASNSATTTFDVVLPTTFAVTFHATGLPAGTVWTVTVNGASSANNSTAIAFAEPSGSYSYTVRAAGFVGAPSAGTFSVSTSDVSVTVAFSPFLFTVTFGETGLTGVNWSVTLGSSTRATTGSSLTFSEPNGSYNYTVGLLAGYTFAPSSGTILINGATPSTVVVGFTAVTYTLTFNETGLPGSSTWSVTLNGLSTSSSSSSIALNRPNGTYTYAFHASGYTATPAGGTVTLSGASAAPITVHFAVEAFAVTFQQSTLPPGTNWSVTFNSVKQTSNLPTIVFTSGSGNFSWKVSAAGFKATPASGNTSVNGANPTPITVRFAALLYTLSFHETGLPQGSYWAVVINGIADNQSTPYINVSVPNGTYFLSFDAPAGYTPINPPPSATVAGGVKSVSVQMVTFNSLVAPPPATFLGFTDLTGYYIFAGIIAGCAGGGGGLGYWLGRRATRKTLASEFM